MMSLTQICHQFILKHYSPIDYAIDATCGNGLDTEFLLNTISSHGKVFAFDIQDMAIVNTQSRTLTLQNASQLSLFHASHHKMLEYIPKDLHQKINVVMFNLGYLPKGPLPSITTKAESTLEALNQLPQLLAQKAVVSILAYPGHPQGKIETEQIKRWLDTQTIFSIDQHEGVKSEISPILWLLHPKTSSLA